MNIKHLLTGIAIFTLAQILAWYQTNGQFISSWMKDHPLLVSIIVGIPTGVCYIYGTKFIVSAGPEQALWPSRLIGFSCGIVTFTIITYLHTGESINLKTASCLALALGIMLIQVLWK